MSCNLLTMGKDEPTMHAEDQLYESPGQLKLINFLGIKKYLLDRLIFKRRKSTYSIQKIADSNQLIINASQNHKQPYIPPKGYTYNIQIIQKAQNLSIPVLNLKPIISQQNKEQQLMTIIYSHGNSSDLADSLIFIEKISQKLMAEFIIYDYSGYGESRVRDVGEETICEDLQLVMASCKRPLDKIILWGFSLGTYPVVYNASKYAVRGIILQCPIASVACMFYKILHADVQFKEDYFANINHICKIKSSKIFIAHSTADEIIPFSHAKILFDKYLQENSTDNISFVELTNIKHCHLHAFISSNLTNALQRELFSFLQETINTKSKALNKIPQYFRQLRSIMKLVKFHQQNEVYSHEATERQLIEGHNYSKKQKINVVQESNSIGIGCFCFKQNSN